MAWRSQKNCAEWLRERETYLPDLLAIFWPGNVSSSECLKWRSPAEYN
jgi:hypothetical protein